MHQVRRNGRMHYKWSLFRNGGRIHILVLSVLFCCVYGKAGGRSILRDAPRSKVMPSEISCGVRDERPRAESVGDAVRSWWSLRVFGGNSTSNRAVRVDGMDNGNFRLMQMASKRRD